MSLYNLPHQVKNGIENESLKMLRKIKQHIVVIGGWAARAHSGSTHIRYTFDIDAVASEQGQKQAYQALEEQGFCIVDEEWGGRATIPYKAPVDVEAEDLKIKVEIFPPRIYEIDGSHYFEFDLRETKEKEVVSMDGNTRVRIMVPDINYLVANKLGLPPLFKNMYDGCLLTQKSDISRVSQLIRKIDDWGDLAQIRISRTLKTLKEEGSILYRELSKTGEIREIRRKLEKILNQLDHRT